MPRKSVVVWVVVAPGMVTWTVVDCADARAVRAVVRRMVVNCILAFVVVIASCGATSERGLAVVICETGSVRVASGRRKLVATKVRSRLLMDRKLASNPERRC